MFISHTISVAISSDTFLDSGRVLANQDRPVAPDGSRAEGLWVNTFSGLN